MSASVLRLPAAALTSTHASPPHALLADHLAVHFEGALSRRECVGYARGVYAGRAAWVPNFDGVQFTLGRAWYVHLETDRADEYFAHAAEADASVERFVPGLADRLLALMQLFVGAPVRRREGYCGPGVHVFPAGAYVSHHGGDVHYDWEGLTDAQLEAHVPALSAILMLQPAAQGGGLRLWDKLHEGDQTDEEPGSCESRVVTYGAGDLVFIDSYRLHQICESSGPLDRISMTAHAALDPEHGWEAWF
jgi:hypothetical protein